MAVNWVSSTQVYVNSYGSLYPLILFGSTVDPSSEYIPTSFQWGTWNTIDLTPYGVTADAVWADIGGIALITGGGELEILCRGLGSTDSSYDEQGLSWSSQGGDRSVLFDTVPLANGMFQFWAQAYTYPRGGTFEVGGSTGVGFNIKLKKWAR